VNILLDTNIILNIIRAKNSDAVLRFISADTTKIIYVSVVCEAEMRSIAGQHNWGTKKLNFLEEFFSKINLIDVSRAMVSTYVQIDSYSQCKNSNFEFYPFKSARNMGKNDLWIAALASMFNLELITADHDFDHLHEVFFKVRKIDSDEFKRFF
jgi:tRNA(fMet)-specific endonuclease VapC